MSLESLVQQRLMRLRAVERALHDPHGWTLRCDGGEAPVEVTRGEESILFSASLPPMCSVGDEFPLAYFCKDGEPVYAIRLDTHLGEAGTEVSFEITFGALVAE